MNCGWICNRAQNINGALVNESFYFCDVAWFELVRKYYL